MEGLGVLLLVGISWLLFIGLGAYISIQKNRDAGEGVLLAALFGPLGIIVAALLPNKQPPSSRSRPKKSIQQLAQEQEAWELRQLGLDGSIDDDEALKYLDE